MIKESEVKIKHMTNIRRTLLALTLTLITLLLVCDNKVAFNSKLPAEDKQEELNIIENKEDNSADVKIYEQTKVQTLKKVIVIDPGHSKGGNKGMERNSPYSDVLKVKDPGGATGVSKGLNEYEVNMMVARKLKVLLEKDGFNVIMSKNSNEENPGNVDRANIGNDSKASLVLRIHCDSNNSSSAHGASMLVPEPVGYARDVYKVSQQYGDIILNNFVNSTGAKNRGISKRSDITGFNWSKVPVVLIEMGFMSNTEEDKLLASDNYQNMITKGLLNGIKEIFH
ncbi:N-acetylmuramoyl-L-alanine amidase [Clostridium sp.]|uniref:N-acetylmuramoyl-L-alanine amidase n=1 Tax=Clostridium sp. TaxID=1506 RepID=UPI003D6D1534